MTRPAIAPCFRSSLARAVLLLIATLAGAGVARAAEAGRFAFEIAAGPAAEALTLFAAQAQCEIMFPAESVRHLQTNAVKGTLPVREALDRLVARTGLVVIEDEKSRALMVVPAGGALSDPSASTPPNPKNVTTDPSFPRLRRLLALAGLTAAAHAQTASAPSSAPEKESAVMLSVFEVTSDKDTGYVASSAMSGTRTNEKLANLPNSISVMTPEFLQDLAFNNYFDAIAFAPNVENIVDDQGTVGAITGARSGNQVSIRGLVTIRQLRDGFPWYLSEDVYNTERIEFSRGPGGLAYGDVDAGGIINVVTKRATFRRSGTAQVRYDSFGTQRYSLDVNQPLVPGRLGLRVNAIHSEFEQWKQRQGRDLEGYAGALRWEPFKDHRTQIDAMYETGNTTYHLGHLQLNDATIAYVPGSATNALDANPNLAGVQNNGVGMARMQAAGNTHALADIGGTLYNLTSTATAVYRMSAVIDTNAAISATDPQNPRLFPIRSISSSVIPLRQDWGGPDNKQTAKYHAYTIELKHAFSDRLNLLVAHNGQVDDTERKQAFSSFGARNLNAVGRAVFIDVNPTLPNPNGSGSIPNPNLEKLFIVHAPVFKTDGHEIDNWRGQLVYDAQLPWDITQRIVLGANYRHEKYYVDNYVLALTREEIARRGFTGAGALYTNNIVNLVHYLQDGNGDAALGWSPKPGVTEFFRSALGSGSNNRLDQSLATGSVNVLGSYFKNRLRTSAGISRDHWLQSAGLALRDDPVVGDQHFVARDGSLIPNLGTTSVTGVPLVPFANTWSTNQTYGVVWHALPWVSLTAGYFESSQFSDNYGLDLDGKALLPLSGEGSDYSARFHLLGGRAEATVTYFSTKQENLSSSVDAAVRDELNPLLNTRFANLIDYRDRTSTGWEYGLTTNLARNWTLVASYSRTTTEFTRFFPLLGTKIAEAQANAKARGLNPDDATALTRQYLEEQSGNIAATTNQIKAGIAPTIRSTASLTTRYSVTQGWLRGFAAGVAARYARGQPVAAVSVAGVEVLPAKTNESYVFTNPFITYRRKFGATNWTFQLNVNNVFDVRSNQGNSYRWPRYTDPRQFIYTATVAF